jgi:hypothetical protein
LLSDSVNDACNILKHLLLSVKDGIAPVKQIRIKHRTEPWIDSDILSVINERDKAFNKYKCDRNDSLKTLKNNVQYLGAKAKKEYLTNTLEENKNDPTSLWETVKNLGLPSKKGSSSTGSNICLNIDDNVCFEKKLIAESLNKFYTTVACKLDEKLPESVHKFGTNFVNTFYANKGVFANSFSFSIVSESKVLKYLTSLGVKKATGLDGIPSRLIRDGSPVIIVAS